MSEISLSVDAVSELIEEIKVLRAENERLRVALKGLSHPAWDKTLCWCLEDIGYHGRKEHRKWCQQARGALNPPAQTGGSQ